MPVKCKSIACGGEPPGGNSFLFFCLAIKNRRNIILLRLRGKRKLCPKRLSKQLT